MSLQPGCVRVLDCTPISGELLGSVLDWQRKNVGSTTADDTWLELRCSYESKGDEEMALAIPFSADVGTGDVVDVAAVPVIGMRFGDDFSKPPTQLGVASLLQQQSDRWVAKPPSGD